MTRRLISWPLPLNIGLIAIGALALGFRAADNIPQPTTETRTVVQQGTRTVISTERVRKVVKGRVVYRDEKVYIRVPLVVVRTDHHTIRVPAHLLPIRSAGATIASPLVTVYIPVSSTIYVPTTETVTSIVTSTDTITIPTTITLPLVPTTSDR